MSDDDHFQRASGLLNRREFALMLCSGLLKQAHPGEEDPLNSDVVGRALLAILAEVANIYISVDESANRDSFLDTIAEIARIGFNAAIKARDEYDEDEDYADEDPTS